MKKKYIIIGITGFCILLLMGWLGLPANYYVRRALIHQRPKIDQYPIFENRLVRAGDPQPWEFSEYYNNYTIPDQYIGDFEKLGTVAYVIIRDGRLFFEQYWEDYSPQSLSNSFSMAKSIVSLAVGCAIDDGFIRDIEQPVSDFFPQFTGYNGEPLTIRHLLTMRAGFDFQESYSSLFSPTTQLYYGNDLKKITFGMKSIAEPGVNFVYQSGVTQLLGFILEKATGESVSTYVSRKLWTPIQAEEDALWSLDRKDGMEKAYCCFNTNARDFARLGQLILNDGRWNERQVVSEGYINEKPPLTPPKEGDLDRYGYHIWRLERNGTTITYMRGILGQYIFVIPEKNAVVVRLGRQRMKEYTENQGYPADIDVWLDAAFDMLDSCPKRARLVFGGDLMQHIPQVNASRYNKTGKYDYSESFQYVKPLFQQADIAVVNLETTISANGKFTGYPLFRSPKEVVEIMDDVGIDVAVMANNHVFDGNKQGVFTTLSYLDSVGIRHTGVFTDSSDLQNNHPLYIQANGLRFALLNYTYGTNGLPTPAGLIVNRMDTSVLISDLKQIDRTTTDGVIVYFHWGNEYERQPNRQQKELAEICHRYGAEIVIGSHPHVVQPISYREEEDGYIRRVTVYSLGNLVSNQRNRYQDGGIIVAIDVIKEKDKPLSLSVLYSPVWVQLPKYRILTLSAADTLPLSANERKTYQQFINDTKLIVKP